MRVLEQSADAADIRERGCVVAIGTFDGVHLGHQKLISRAVELAREAGVAAVIFTFRNHPMSVLAPDREPLSLYPLEERRRVFAKLGVDFVIEEPFTEELAEALKPAGVISLWLNENRERTNVILSRKFHLIYGRETLPDTLCGLRFELSPASFFQVNPLQTERLYETALEFAGLKPHENVCDVYCGAGTITLAAAPRCASAVGIEIVPEAVENARRNAERNGITNAEFHAGPAEELLPRMVAEGLRCDAVLVDPPRKGLEPEVITAIAQAGPSRVVYVSCNPATLARDAARFLEAGYRAEKVQPVDMFCRTSGIETVCLLSKV
jgi:23S rRNA (uracil1939-C5)-methyltransferase